MSDVQTSNQPDEQRYEGRVGGELAGFAAYQLDGDRIFFTHTEVDDAYEGQGVGSAIVRFALEDVRGRGDLRVVPRCQFVRSWIEQHPEFAPLVEGAAAGTAEDCSGAVASPQASAQADPPLCTPRRSRAHPINRFAPLPGGFGVRVVP